MVDRQTSPIGSAFNASMPWLGDDLKPALESLLRLATAASGEHGSAQNKKYHEDIASPVDPAIFEPELASLRASSLLFKQGWFEVFLANTKQAPHLLREVFRQREVAFRAVGEGTGKSIDRDVFDDHYVHLLIWHASSREIVGAYRLACTEDVMGQHGVAGLYTSTLFDFDEELIARIGPAMELGRSFVVPHWQKSHQPLKLLWAGIAAVLRARPKIKTLFGPVSISADLSPLSRSLIREVLSEHYGDREFARLVKPRNPLAEWGSREDRLSVTAALGNVEALAGAIAWLEGRNAMPVLIRQYLNLRGRFAGFNVDAEFSQALDGLVFVGVDDIPAAVLERLYRTGARSSDA